MATLCSSSSNNFDRTMTNVTTMGSNSNTARRVRVVAKIRGFSDQEAEFLKGASWITVNKPKGEDSESVTISFGDQSASRKDSYEVDFCYQQNEGNDLIFSREVKPLISGVFEGNNTTVFAYGARSTGKTSVIQGSCEKPGLAALAMAEILSSAEDNGKSVSISFYEVYQDRVCDLLDSKQQAVFVLEDKQGKIQLKGLSRVPVRAISDFEKLYVGMNSNKLSQKTTTETRKSHKGLIVYISSSTDDSLRVGKMNFVDLAGYEDVRRKSTDSLNLSEQNKINTSVYAFLNVIHALSANISHVPYRESKLARILQDSLGGFSKVVMITCLSPTFCQDSMYMVKLASRPFQKISSVILDSTKKNQSLKRTKMVSSIKRETPKTVCAATKKQAFSRLQVPLSEKKVNVIVPFAVRGRKLFGEKSKLTASDENASMKTASSVLNRVSIDKPLADEQENALPDVPKHTEATFIAEKDNPSSESEHAQFTFAPTKDGIEVGEDEPEAITPGFDFISKTNSLSLAQEGQDTEKEKIGTPPISSRLRELSNNLKALCSATPFSVEITEKTEPDVLVPNDTIEPTTPKTGQSVTVDTRSNYKVVNSPWEALSVRSTGMKKSIVQEYLKFLNTADKEELKRLRGIGEKRATLILELREESPEPFKSVEDLKNIGLHRKQVKDMMAIEGPLFD